MMSGTSGEKSERSAEKDDKTTMKKHECSMTAASVSTIKRRKCSMTAASVSTLLTLLGVNEIQQILKFMCKDDLLRLTLVCKSMEAQVEELCSCVLRTVWSHHKLPPQPTQLSDSWTKGSLRRELEQTMKKPLYRLNLPENQGVWGCRALALSPSEDQLAIADIALEQLRDRDAYKVILWDLSRKEVSQTIRHEIAPAEHLGNGNYSLQLFWMANDLLVTCSPASISVWSTLTGNMMHRYCRYPASTSPAQRQKSYRMMRYFVRKDDTKILFVAEKASEVHAFDIQNGLVQENVCSTTMHIRGLVVCQNSFLIALGVASRKHGLLLIDLKQSSRVHQFYPGNYCNITPPASPSSRTVLAFRVEGDERTRVTRCFVDVLELSHAGTLWRRRMVPFASATTQVLAAWEGQFFAKDLVNAKKIWVVNSLTGEFESSFHCDGQASFSPQSAVVAPRRKELIIGLDIAKSGSSGAMVFSLLDVNR